MGRRSTAVSPAVPVALGAHCHTGWAAVVAVASGDQGLEVVAKERIQVAFTFEEGAVYHAGESLPLDQAEALITRAREQYTAGAARQLAAACAKLERFRLGGYAVAWGTEKPLPRLEEILRSHALIHTAEGALYRRIFLQAGVACGLEASALPAKELEARAAKALGQSPAALADLLARMGKASGRPWTVDQKKAALAAICVLPRP